MATLVRPRHETLLSPTSLEGWRGVESTILADLTLGACICDPEIRPLRRGSRLCGQAMTVRCDPGDLGAVAHAVERAGPGDLIVIAAGATPTQAVFGDLLATAARIAGASGVLVDGAVRDVGTLRRWENFSVWARYRVARASPGKSGGEVNGEISFGGQLVRPGDLVVADEEGVAVVPLHQADALLTAALDRLRFEAHVAEAVALGEKPSAFFDLPAAVELEFGDGRLDPGRGRSAA